MTAFRLQALSIFEQKIMPTWGADLSELPMQDIRYYVQPTDQQKKSWDEVSLSVRRTFDRLGIPQAEQKLLAGVGAQYESEVVYKNLQKKWADQGVIFCDTDNAVHP